MINGCSKTYNGSLVAVLGDNLGSHQIGGFTENFSNSKFFCRFCFYDRESLLANNFQKAEKRNPLNYSECVNNLDTNPNTNLGVNKKSCLNELKYFNVCEGLPSCLAHDLFEGIIPYDLMEICRYFCRKNIITENRINMFFIKICKDFKLSISFPTLDLKMKKMPGKADEIRYFLFLFPLIFLEIFEQHDDPVWQFLTAMVEMSRLICSTEISEDQISLLEYYIELYMQFRIECFPHIKLRPKHHYIVHYPEQIKNFGPLRQLWTMRFEQKHSYFKQISKNLKNFKNITYSLVTKHQQMQVNCYGDRFRKNIVCDNTEYLHKDMFNFKLPECFEFVTKKIRFLNTEFKENDFIVIHLNNDENIKVLKITHIFIDNKYENAIFYGNEINMWYNYKTLLYESFDAFNVYAVANLKDLIVRNPVKMYYLKQKYFLPLFEFG